MEFQQIGLDIKHIGKFGIERPYGSYNYLFLIFQTGARLHLGKEIIDVLPNACILFQKGFPQFYYSTANYYVDSYLHFECSSTELKMLQQRMNAGKLSFNSPFYLKNKGEIMDIMKMISREQVSFSCNKKQNLDHLINLFLLKLIDNATEKTVTLEKSRHIQKLIELRSEMYSNSGKYNSVTEMAEKSNLSISHFKFLYSQYFGISCYDDLLTAKIKNAQHHLMNTDLSIKEIAVLCGYENDTSFMRSFKKRTGVTPSEFRSMER